MISNGAAAPRLGASIAGLIANRIWLILIAGALGHLGAWHWFLDLFAHFRWQYLFASALCCCAAIYAKKARLIGMGVLGVLWNFALISQYSLAHPSLVPTAAEPLKLLFSKCAVNNKGNSLITLIRAEAPDVIAAAELSEALSQRVKTEFSANYTVQALFPDSGWQGIGVLVRNGRLHNVSADLVDPAELEFPTARLRFQGCELLVVHPIAPIATDAAASRDAFFNG